MATKRIDRSKRTKAELVEELENLQDQLAGQAAPDPTAAAVARTNAAATREAVKGLSVDQIVQNGAKFGLEVQRTVSELTQQAVQKAEELKTLQAAIEVETKELERLYQLDVAAASVQALISEHETMKAGLEKSIAAVRQAWDEEVQSHQKFVSQRNNELEATRRREQADYDYRTKQERERAQEEFNYKLRIAERNQAEQAARAQKEIDERLAAIRAQEEAIAAGNARIAGLDEEIKQASASAAAIAASSVKKDLEAKFALERKELEFQTQLAKQALISSEERNSRNLEEINKLQMQLDAARAEVRDIAKSAVEGASGQLALSKVMEVRQENGQPTRKS